MKERVKSYKFWVALSGAVVIFVKALGKALDIEINPEVVDGIIMGFCGILVAMGLVEKPKSPAGALLQKPSCQDQNLENEDKQTDQTSPPSPTQNKE